MLCLDYIVKALLDDSSSLEGKFTAGSETLSKRATLGSSGSLFCPAAPGESNGLQVLAETGMNRLELGLLISQRLHVITKRGKTFQTLFFYLGPHRVVYKSDLLGSSSSLSASPPMWTA